MKKRLIKVDNTEIYGTTDAATAKTGKRKHWRHSDFGLWACVRRASSLACRRRDRTTIHGSLHSASHHAKPLKTTTRKNVLQRRARGEPGMRRGGADSSPPADRWANSAVLPAKAWTRRRCTGRGELGQRRGGARSPPTGPCVRRCIGGRPAAEVRWRAGAACCQRVELTGCCGSDCDGHRRRGWQRR